MAYSGALSTLKLSEFSTYFDFPVHRVLPSVLDSDEVSYLVMLRIDCSCA